MTEADSGSRPIFGIYGAGGCGRGVLPVAGAMLGRQYGPEGYELVFVDDAVSETVVNGRRVLNYEEFVALGSSLQAVAIAIAVADCRARYRLAERCRNDGLASFTVKAHNTVVMDDVQIGEGAILSPFVTLTSNIRIGRHFHANLYSYVEHDCVIGDFVTFAPSVHCNGNVVVEDYAYIGSGAVLRQGRPGEPLVVGRGATIGMGAVVTKNVQPDATVVGNPAHPLHKT